MYLFIRFFFFGQHIHIFVIDFLFIRIVTLGESKSNRVVFRGTQLHLIITLSATVSKTFLNQNSNE